MVKPYTLVAVGRAYTDIVATVDPAFLEKHQIPPDGDKRVTAAELKAMQAELVNPQTFPGGPSANTAAVVAALGGKAGYFGKVRNDADGNAFLDDMKQRGVELCCAGFAPGTDISATALVLLTDDKRSLAFNPGCADSFIEREFQAFDFKTTDFFLFEAHLLTNPKLAPKMSRVLRAAAEDTVVVANLQGMPSWEDPRVTARFVANEVDIIIGNAAEQSTFSFAKGRSPISEDTLIVITKGPKGSEAFWYGEHYAVPAQQPERMVSAVGAGDAYLAGLLRGLSHYKSIRRAMELAASTAAASLAEPGPRLTRSLQHLVIA